MVVLVLFMSGVGGNAAKAAANRLCSILVSGDVGDGVTATAAAAVGNVEVEPTELTSELLDEEEDEDKSMAAACCWCCAMSVWEMPPRGARLPRPVPFRTMRFML